MIGIDLELIKHNIDALQSQINELANIINRIVDDVVSNKLCYQRVYNLEMKLLLKENEELEKALNK